MVELQNHLGIVVLSRGHEGQQGVVLNQPHRIPEPGISRECRDIVVRLLMEPSAVEPYIPRDGVPDEQWPPNPGSGRQLR